MDDRSSLREVGLLFLKLGFTAFGGPAAHMAMMQHEVVGKRKWLDSQRFLDMVGTVNLIPGPNSTELAIHIGYERAGWRGLITAGLCFILPAVLITGAFAWSYKAYGTLPQVQPFIYGIKPAIIAVILSAAYPLARSAVRSAGLALLGLVVLVLAVLGVNEVMLLFGAGLMMLILRYVKGRASGRAYGFCPVAACALLAGQCNDMNVRLFLIFLKIGALLYGSGYVLFAFLDAELVGSGLITRQQLMDAVAVGQFTPGPVFSSVTFIGYQISGWKGACASTLGIFIPSFILVALVGPLSARLRSSKLMSAFLDAANVASVAIIFSVCYVMARETLSDWRTVLLTSFALLIAFRFRTVNSAFIVAGGAIGGYLLSLV